MEFSTIFSRKTLVPRLRALLQQQQLLVFIGVIIYALFAALKIQPPFVVMMVIILCVGNAISPVMSVCVPYCNKRDFPWNWVLFLPILLAVSFVSAMASVVLVRWMMPIQQPFWAFAREIAPTGFVVCMAGGTLGYVVFQVQSRLQEKNRVLQQAVEKGTTALQQQEQELDRAREIQQDLMPKVLPQLPRVELAGAWQPARTVGGDYFDVVQLDSNRLAGC